SQMSIEHVVVMSGLPYDDAIKSLEERLGVFGDSNDLKAQLAVQKPSWEKIVHLIESKMGSSGLTVFHQIDQGALLAFKGKALRARQYAIGNPLLAIGMIERAPGVALYAPLRIAIYEDNDGNAVFTYELFSSQTLQFQNREVQSVAETVTEKVEALIAA